MASSRYQRAKPARVRKPVVLLVTEGAHTEVLYFEELKKMHRSVVTLLISGGRPGELNPRRVLKRLRNEVAKHRRNKDWLKGDSAWLVVDTDQWAEEEKRDILKETRQGDFQLAASNPCFEVWLLMHFRSAWSTATAKDLRDLLASRDCLGRFAKNSYPAAALIPKIQAAIDRARQVDSTNPDAWPGGGATRVHKAVEAIIQAQENRGG
jgi:hypothetical protein